MNAAMEAELAAARAALVSLDPNPGTSKLTGKQHTVRVNATLRRAAQLVATVQRLERLGDVDAQPPRDPAPLDLSRLPYAAFIRTRYGWYEVVKVNAKSVRVLAEPGMNDRIPIGRILEIRERTEEGRPMIDSDWIAVIPDGIDRIIECGLCGYRERGLTPDNVEAARQRHAKECEED